MPDMKVYARAEAWVAEHREALERDFPGQYLYMDARTLLYVIAPSHNEASKVWSGPLPFEGRAVFGVTIKP